jgi:hypothetical protein
MTRPRLRLFYVSRLSALAWCPSTAAHAITWEGQGQGQLWVRGEMMGPGKCENVGKYQSVLMMIDPMISPRTRSLCRGWGWGWALTSMGSRTARRASALPCCASRCTSLSWVGRGVGSAATLFTCAAVHRVVVIESRWVSRQLAFASELRPPRLNRQPHLQRHARTHARTAVAAAAAAAAVSEPGTTHHMRPDRQTQRGEARRRSLGAALSSVCLDWPRSRPREEAAAVTCGCPPHRT